MVGLPNRSKKLPKNAKSKVSTAKVVNALHSFLVSANASAGASANAHADTNINDSVRSVDHAGLTGGGQCADTSSSVWDVTSATGASDSEWVSESETPEASKQGPNQTSIVDTFPPLSSQVMTMTNKLTWFVGHRVIGSHETR